MNDWEIVKFTNGALELNVRVSMEENTVYLSKEQMALLFDRDRSVISRIINKIYEAGELEKASTCAKNAQVQQEGDRSVRRVFDYYNLDVVIAVGYRVKSNSGLRLKGWFENYVSEKNREIIVYNNGSVQLDVRIEPTEETVWLTQNQMADLFETTQQNISQHIQNILSDEELDDSVHKKSLYTAQDGKTYSVDFYNLDAILAVGYRVKGWRATQFRKWASSVLKQYLLKGYAIDGQRAVISKQNYLDLLEKVNGLDTDVRQIKEILNSKVRNSFICYEGRYYDGFAFVNELICSAKKRVIIIDGYADRSVLDFFVGSKRGLEKAVLCHKAERIDPEVLERFIKQYGEIKIKEERSYHDRFLIVDDEIYLLGASLNSLGNKTSAITKTDQYIIEDIYQGE